MPGWVVICLCAQWCGVCRQWRADFEQAAARHPDARFAWVDVEDEADAMGDVEVETFPTVLVAHGEDVYFLGPIAPSATQMERLLASFEGVAPPARANAADHRALLSRLRVHTLPDENA